MLAPPQQADLTSRWKFALTSDLARAGVASLAGTITILVMGVALTLDDGVDWSAILKWMCYLVGSAFLLVSARAFTELFAKELRALANVIEAATEIVTRQDLNHSGQVGDIITLEPETKEVIRLVPTNQRQKVIAAPSGAEIHIEDFVEFVRALETRGIERSKWISESRAKPFAHKFASGRTMDRALYDAMCEILEKRARVLHARRQGTSGTLTATPTEILNRLGLE